MRLSTPARIDTSVPCEPVARAHRLEPVSTLSRYIKVSAAIAGGSRLSYSSRQTSRLAAAISLRWTQKHGKSHFGYKLSINVDSKYKFICQIETGTASTLDSQHFEKDIDPCNTSRDVYADKGYPSEAREAWLKGKGFPEPDPEKNENATRRCPPASSGATSASPKRVPGSSMCLLQSGRWVES